MSTSRLTTKVQELYAAFGRGDLAFILNRLAPDVVWEIQGPAGVPLFGQRQGREEVAAFFRILAEHFDVEKFEPREFIAEEDQVVVIGLERTRVRKNGRVSEGEWVHVWEFQGGMAVHFREFSNTAAVAEAFTAARAAA